MNNITLFEKIIYVLHFFIFILFIVIPFLPNKYLIWIFPLPSLVFLVWTIFDCCPLTKYSQKNMEVKDSFSKPIFDKFFKKEISQFQLDSFASFLISLIIIISAYKLIYFNKKSIIIEEITL